MQRRSIAFAVWLALSTLTAAAQDLTGVWSADDGGMYYVRQIDNQVWWAGLSAISSLGANDIHPGIHFSNVFFGTVSGSTISGDWADVPRGTILQSGTISLIISGNQLKKTASTGGFGATTWTRQNITQKPFDVFNVFDTVRKNNAGGGSLLDNLKPAKAWPVSVFGTLKQTGSDPVLQLAYPPTSGRSYWDFACQDGGGDQDGDIDIDLTVDRANLDSQFGFWTQGWESNHEVTASRFQAKLDADNNRLHLESVMFGGDKDCDDDGAPHYLVPGWQNAGASGVLFNGMPIAGQISLSPYKDKSAITAIMGRVLHAGDRIRVNGILVLDCGHSTWWPPEYHPCYEDDSSQNNQEMHPIYSIDVVEDFSHSWRFFANLTGAWAANDNGTYYVRQLGNTIWWLALSSDEGHSEAHVFHGAFSFGGTSFTGSWADVPLGTLFGGGALTVNAPQGAKSITLSKASGGAFASTWDKLRDVITIPIINQVAEQYVHLVLALGQHDPDYVDAFYGPPEWKTQAEKEKKSLDAIGAEAAELLKKLSVESLAAPLVESSEAGSSGDEMLKLRREYLQRQISALAARVRMLNGEKLKFDDESRALYDAVAPTFPDSHFDQIISQLESKIPGEGPLWERYEKWRKPFVIPKEKLDAVFQAAIKECRARTLAHVGLPPNESFTVEYVTNKPWGGYNWYKGNFHSVIQVNTDLPIYIDRAVDLAAHEGYPGHHVYNSLLEKNLVRDRDWVEFSVYALFSPQSLIAEGTANFGRDVAFPTKAERMKFEKEVLFPAAGIDASRADEFYAVQDLLKQLDYAANEAARRLVNGEIDENAAVQWLQKYAVMDQARAQQRVKFIKRYRSYVINYNLGEDMVRRYIEKRSGVDPEKRWSEFGKLLSSPRLPSGIQN